MLSKTKIKYIRSLELKKKRKEEQAFVAEGHKLVGDLLGHFPCNLLIATSNWLKMNHSATANEIIEVTQEELSRASLQKTPQEVLAVAEWFIFSQLEVAISNLQDVYKRQALSV